MEIQLWRSILCPYELAVRELMVKFEHIIDEHKQNDLYSPIEQVSGRVKSLPSILEKMQRKHIPMDKMEEEIEDIAGIRIICQFEEDIDTVAAIIRDRSDMVIKSEKNYLKHIKQSGYRSYHLIIYYTVDTISGPKRLQAEIQIRTMAMNFWATIEHSLQYKYKGEMPLNVAERLSNAADAIIALDHEMSATKSWMRKILLKCSPILSKIFFSASKIFTRFPTNGKSKKFRTNFCVFSERRICSSLHVFTVSLILLPRAIVHSPYHFRSNACRIFYQ